MKKIYLFITTLLFCVIKINAQSHIYLTSPGQSNIYRINQDGTGEITIGSPINTPRGIELDISNNKMYFVDGGGDRIMTDDLGGTGRTVVVNTSEPVDLALDLSNQIIYFTDNVEGKIKRVNFEGTGLTDVITGLTTPNGIDFDESLGKIFWCDNSAKTINSVNSDGTNQQLLYTSTNSPAGLAIDKVNQKIYWTERSNDLLRSSNYDGSSVSTVLAIQASTGIAVDNLNNKIYWCENTSSSLKRVNFDGTDSETVYANTGLSGIALNINSVLPVELINFQGQLENKVIELSWSTASELNNLGFEIQKSTDGRNWNIIDFIKGQGTITEINEYQYQDFNPFSGTNYYRLKQIDFDGAFEYSKVISVEYGNSERSFNIFPNPSNGMINLQIDNLSNQRMNVKIFDNFGREVWASKLIESEADWRKEIEINGNGIYFVFAQIEDEIHYEKVIISNEK